MYQRRSGRSVTATVPRPSSSEKDHNVELLKEAIAGGHLVRFSYFDAKGKQTSLEAKPREWQYVEHNHGWAGGGNLCVVAFCNMRQEDRFFAVHRISISMS